MTIHIPLSLEGIKYNIICFHCKTIFQRVKLANFCASAAAREIIMGKEYQLNSGASSHGLTLGVKRMILVDFN